MEVIHCSNCGEPLGSRALIALCRDCALPLTENVLAQVQVIEEQIAEAVAAEREACAVVVAEKRQAIQKTYGRMGGTWRMINTILTQVEEAIRTRGGDNGKE